MLLETAWLFMKQKGFNGFSTRELADEVCISSASLHHHFATKADLAAAVVAHCRERLNQRKSEIAAEVEGFELRVRHVAETLGEDAALIGMLAADFPMLPGKAQEEARQLFENMRGWLTRFAIQARNDGELPSDTAPDAVAASVLASLLGQALLARTEVSATAPLPASAWAWQ